MGAPLLAVFEKGPIRAAAAIRLGSYAARLTFFITVVLCPPSLLPPPFTTILARCGTICIATTAPETCTLSPAAVIAGSRCWALPAAGNLFLKVLEQVRQRYVLVVVGYVVMPEHIHLLLSEPQETGGSWVIKPAFDKSYRFYGRLAIVRQRDVYSYVQRNGCAVWTSEPGAAVPTAPLFSDWPVC